MPLKGPRGPFRNHFGSSQVAQTIACKGDLCMPHPWQPAALHPNPCGSGQKGGGVIPVPLAGVKHVSGLLKQVKEEAKQLLDNVSIALLELYQSEAVKQAGGQALGSMGSVPENDTGLDGRPVPFYVDFPEAAPTHATLAGLDGIAEGRLKRKFFQHVAFNPTDSKTEHPSTTKKQRMRRELGEKCVVCGKDGTLAHLLRTQALATAARVQWDITNYVLLCGHLGDRGSCHHLFDVGKMSFVHKH